MGLLCLYICMYLELSSVSRNRSKQTHVCGRNLLNMFWVPGALCVWAPRQGGYGGEASHEQALWWARRVEPGGVRKAQA